MKAITEDSKTIVFHEGNHIAGKLVYQGRFSKKASIIDAENLVYEIVAVNFWKSRFEVRLDLQSVFIIKKRWAGRAEISSNRDAESDKLIFKHRGIFKIRFVIQDKDDRELAVVRSKFSWESFRHDYDIEITDSLKRKSHYFAILGVMIYLVRNMKRQHAGVAGGIGGALAAIN